MDENALNQLSPEQLAGLNEDQKAIFCALGAADQKFFAQAFSVKDLPAVLERKGEILKRNQAVKERTDKIEDSLAQVKPEAPAETSATDILTAVAGVVGVGAAAAAVASDNTAHWAGVKPNDLVAPLRTEFNTDKTQLAVSGNPQALVATVLLTGGGGQGVAALTINLADVDQGTEVKMSELTSHGTLETIKEGGKKVLDIAGDGLLLLARNKFGMSSPVDVLNTASHTLDKGSDLAEIAGNLKIKDRAWKVIKQTADSIEASYQSAQEAARQARLALEGAWDRYNNCPTCGVSFQPGDTTCRVCGAARPEKPLKPDPRQP